MYTYSTIPELIELLDKHWNDNETFSLHYKHDKKYNLIEFTLLQNGNILYEFVCSPENIGFPIRIWKTLEELPELKMFLDRIYQYEYKSMEQEVLTGDDIELSDHVMVSDPCYDTDTAIYGDKWSMTDFITKNTSQRTLEQDFIADQLYSILNSKVPIDDVNQNYNIAYKVPDISENRISDVDVYIYPADQEITEPNEHTKHFIMRYQHMTEEQPGYFTAYDTTGPEPTLIARVPHTPDSIDDMVQLTNHLKELSEPMIQKQVKQKKQLSRFSLNHNVAHEENEDLEP